MTASLRAERSAPEMACAAARAWTAGETWVPLATMSAVASPMIVSTMMTSIRVKPDSPARALEREVIEAQHRNEERSDNTRHEQSHDDRDDRNQKRDEPLHGQADLLIVDVGCTQRHVGELAGFFADLKQVDGLRWKELVLRESSGNPVPGFDP